MPLYEYKCAGCGHKFAELKSVNDRDSAPCEKCGKAAKHSISTVHFDPRMGLDPAFATLSEKWARTRDRAARQKSN